MSDDFDKGICETTNKLPNTSHSIMTEEQFGNFARISIWHFAKTMPKCPHWYVVRKECVDAEFVEAVLYIREHGFDCRWYRDERKYLDFGDHYYWTMGAPVEETIIINRCLKTDYTIENGRMFVAEQLQRE